jgi:hypothetical protein
MKFGSLLYFSSNRVSQRSNTSWGHRRKLASLPLPPRLNDSIKRNRFRAILRAKSRRKSTATTVSSFGRISEAGSTEMPKRTTWDSLTDGFNGQPVWVVTEGFELLIAHRNCQSENGAVEKYTASPVGVPSGAHGKEFVRNNVISDTWRGGEKNASKIAYLSWITNFHHESTGCCLHQCRWS